MKLNPTYSSGDINFIHDEAQIFVESIINNIDENITPTKGYDGDYHWIYLTVNKSNGFFYIGKKTARHGSATTPLKNYYGSGVKILDAIKKEGKDNFLRYILKFYPTQWEAWNAEASILTDQVLSRFSEDLECMYNLQTGGLRGVKKNAFIYSKRSAEMKIKKQKRDEEAKESLERFLKLNPILQKVKLLD
jgi:hypothetical protein